MSLAQIPTLFQCLDRLDGYELVIIILALAVGVLGGVLLYHFLDKR